MRGDRKILKNIFAEHIFLIRPGISVCWKLFPRPDTDPEVTQFLLEYGDLHLGKTTVLCKDSPAFIANRVGVFSIMTIFKLMDKLGLNIDQIETLTGPIIGRPKSATFRTADVVGLDTLGKSGEGSL